MMYCFYDACDNNITKFHPDAESDCILQHLSSISKHYLGEYFDQNNEFITLVHNLYFCSYESENRRGRQRSNEV